MLKNLPSLTRCSPIICRWAAESIGCIDGFGSLANSRSICCSGFLWGGLVPKESIRFKDVEVERWDELDTREADEPATIDAKIEKYFNEIYIWVKFNQLTRSLFWGSSLNHFTSCSSFDCVRALIYDRSHFFASKFPHLDI